MELDVHLQILQISQPQLRKGKPEIDDHIRCCFKCKILHNHILGLYTNILIIINATFIFGMSVITFYNTNLMEYICYNNSRLLPNYN